MTSVTVDLIDQSTIILTDVLTTNRPLSPSIHERELTHADEEGSLRDSLVSLTRCGERHKEMPDRWGYQTLNAHCL